MGSILYFKNLIVNFIFLYKVKIFKIIVVLLIFFCMIDRFGDLGLFKFYFICFECEVGFSSVVEFFLEVYFRSRFME